MRGTPLALVAGLLLAAAKAGPEPPVFRTQAEIVTVDVVVLAADGKPVPGLTRADFVVKEDGKAQAVTAFEAVEARIPAMVAPETTPAGPSAARVATNVSAPPTRRTFAFVFDDLHVDDLNMEQAKRAVQTIVARETHPGDHLVLVTVSDGRYWSTSRASADADWTDALRRVRSHRPLEERPECRVTYYEAMQADVMGNKQAG